MEITTLTTKGQVTVPVQIRRQMGLKPGKKVLFRGKNGSATLEVVPDFFSFRGALKAKRAYDKKVARIAVGKYLGKRQERISSQ